MTIGNEPSPLRNFLLNFGCGITHDNVEHLNILKDALRIYDGRTRSYDQVWKQYGALANLLSAARKVDRLMTLWWFGDGVALHKDALDDAYDALNYLVFFIRLAQKGEITGTPPRRPQDDAT